MISFSILNMLLFLSPSVVYENPKRGLIVASESKRSVTVLPGVGYIVLNKLKEDKLVFFDLEGEFVKNMKFEIHPDRIYEAGGLIFLNSIKVKGFDEYSPMLWTLSSTLEVIRKVKGVSLYSPNKVDGNWYGYDVFKIYTNRSKYPRMAKRFNLDTSSYGDEAFFKMPSKFRRTKMQYKDYWIFSFGEVKLLIMQCSNVVYILDRAYLSREKLDSDKVATPSPNTVALNIPGGFKNPDGFPGDVDIMDTEEAWRKIDGWFAGQTRVTASWQNLDGIIFAVSTQASNQSSVFCLMPTFESKFIKTVPGTVLAGSGQRFWSRTDTEIGIEVNSYVLKER